MISSELQANSDETVELLAELFARYTVCRIQGGLGMYGLEAFGRAVRKSASNPNLDTSISHSPKSCTFDMAMSVSKSFKEVRCVVL